MHTYIEARSEWQCDICPATHSKDRPASAARSYASGDGWSVCADRDGQTVDLCPDCLGRLNETILAWLDAEMGRSVPVPQS